VESAARTTTYWRPLPGAGVAGSGRVLFPCLATRWFLRSRRGPASRLGLAATDGAGVLCCPKGAPSARQQPGLCSLNRVCGVLDLQALVRRSVAATTESGAGHPASHFVRSPSWADVSESGAPSCLVQQKGGERACRRRLPSGRRRPTRSPLRNRWPLRLVVDGVLFGWLRR